MTIEELLDSPEKIAALSDEQLRTLLSPYFPQVRTPVLPEEATKRASMMEVMVKSSMDKNKDLIEQLRKYGNQPR